MSHPLRLPRTGLAASLLLLAASGCDDGTTPDPYASTSPSEGTVGRLHDAEGRELLLRGVNARVDGIFDVTFDDGRLPLEPIPPFTGEDCRFLAEELGLDHLRLPVNWSAIEPNKGDYRADYVDRIVALAADCEAHGVHTLVDLHQDAYSKEIGEDGAPYWAILPEPPMKLGGPLTDLGARRMSQETLAAFESFYDDAEGVQTAYAAMAAWLAKRIEGKPGVVGLELQNEPVLLFGADRLDSFNALVGGAVRRAAPTLTIFFEPNSTRNISDMAPVTAPVPFRDAVYSPHIYVDVFETGWASEDVGAIETSVARAVDEAAQHSASLYVGEFGNGNDTRGLLYTTECERIFDERFASWAFWVYEEWSQGSWGLYDMVDTGSGPSRGALRTATADVLARAYPVATAGHVESFTYVPATKTLTVNLSRARANLDHVLAAPHRTYPNGVVVTCDGAPVAATVAAGRANVRCGGSVLVMGPAD